MLMMRHIKLNLLILLKLGISEKRKLKLATYFTKHFTQQTRNWLTVLIPTLFHLFVKKLKTYSTPPQKKAKLENNLQEVLNASYKL